MRHNAFQALIRRFAAFADDRRGVSAIEFAMILPLMVTLYVGGSEISQAIEVSRKVTMTSHSVADLAAQVTDLKSVDMQNILDASTAVIAPYTSSKLKVTISSVSIDANGKATVDWSCPRNGGTKRSGDVTSLVPAALRVVNTSLLWGEASYAFHPDIGYGLTGDMNLKDQLFMRPRLSNNVTGTC
jgi:Flp pilus assembly protein TadG